MPDKKVIQKIVLGAVIIKNNLALILKRSSNDDIFPGLWEIPSGKKEDLETVEDALIREVKEETNLDIIPEIPFSVFNYQIDKGDYIKDSTQINYLVKLENLSQEVKISAEHEDFSWIGLEEIDNYNMISQFRF